VRVAAHASESGSQPDSCAIFVVLHHPDGLLLPNPARVLHRASSHGVHDVSSPRQRIPITPSCPSKPCSSCAAGVSSGFPSATPGPRHLSEFPRSVHREPCPLILSIRSSLSVSSTLTHGLNVSVAAILVQLSLNSKTSSQMSPESRGFPPHTKQSFQPPFPVV